jgi:hypothetical protein
MGVRVLSILRKRYSGLGFGVWSLEFLHRNGVALIFNNAKLQTPNPKLVSLPLYGKKTHRSLSYPGL